MYLYNCTHHPNHSYEDYDGHEEVSLVRLCVYVWVSCLIDLENVETCDDVHERCICNKHKGTHYKQ